jgi:hypothetical protein
MSQNTLAGPNTERWPWWARAAAPIGYFALVGVLASCTGASSGQAAAPARGGAATPASHGDCASKILSVTTPDGRPAGDRMVSGQAGIVVTMRGCGIPLWLVEHSTGDNNKYTIDYDSDSGNPSPVMTRAGIGGFVDKPIGNPPGTGITSLDLIKAGPECNAYLSGVGPDRRGNYTVSVSRLLQAGCAVVAHASVAYFDN